MKKSLLAPAIDASEEYGAYAVVPSLIGFLIGAAFVYVSDLFLPHDTLEILKPKTTKKEKIETEVISNATNKTVRNRKPKGKLLEKVLESLFIKAGCVFPMVISSVRQYLDDDHREDAPHFILKWMECLNDIFYRFRG